MTEKLRNQPSPRKVIIDALLENGVDITPLPHNAQIILLDTIIKLQKEACKDAIVDFINFYCPYSYIPRDKVADYFFRQRDAVATNIKPEPHEKTTQE